MIKNKILFFVFILLLFSSISAIAQNSQYLEEEKVKSTRVQENNANQCGGENKPLRVAGFVTNPPLGWVDLVSSYNIPRNNGFSFKLLEQIAQEEAQKQIKKSNEITNLLSFKKSRQAFA